MKEILKRGATSNILRVFLQDSASTTGAGKTALTSSSSGLIISTIADNEATATTYTSAATNVETITTLGTFAAPTASKCRFREVDATNFPGVYEIQIADARFAVANSTQLLISIQCTGVAPVYVEYQLVAVDLMDTVRFGLTAIPNVAQGTVGSLPTATATGQVTVATNNDKSNYSLTVTPPTALEIWHVAASSVVTAGTIGLQLKTNIDAAVTTRMASFTYTAPPSVTDIWNTNVSGYTTAGFAGTYLKNAMPTFTYTAPPSVTDIWNTNISGYSSAGFAGTYLKNAMPTFTYTTPLTSTQTAQAVWNALTADYTTNNTFGQRILRSTTSQSTCAVTGSNHIAADIHQMQPDVVTASAVATDAVTEISAGTWNYNISAISTTGTAGLFLTDTNVDTNNILSSVATIEDIPYRKSIADYLLGRNLAGGSDGGRTVTSALRILRNKFTASSTTLTVYAEDDVTTAWTSTLTTDSGAVPITGSDPA